MEHVIRSDIHAVFFTFDTRVAPQFSSACPVFIARMAHSAGHATPINQTGGTSTESHRPKMDSLWWAQNFPIHATENYRIISLGTQTSLLGAIGSKWTRFSFASKGKYTYIHIFIYVSYSCFGGSDVNSTLTSPRELFLHLRNLFEFSFIFIHNSYRIWMEELLWEKRFRASKMVRPRVEYLSCFIFFSSKFHSIEWYGAQLRSCMRTNNRRIKKVSVLTVFS